MRPRNTYYSVGSWGHWYVKGIGFVPYSSFAGPDPDPRVVAAYRGHGASSERGFNTVHRALKAMAHLALMPGTSPWMTKMCRRAVATSKRPMRELIGVVADFKDLRITLRGPGDHWGIPSLRAPLRFAPGRAR